MDSTTETLLIAYAIVTTLALILALVVLAFAKVDAQVYREQAEGARAMADAARRDAMGAEARARGVGGAGEHGMPIVNELSDASRQWVAAFDQRHAIPNGGVGR